MAALEGIAEPVADALAERGLVAGLLGTVEGPENVTELLRGFIAALPDLHAAEQDVGAAVESVAVRYGPCTLKI